GLALLIVHAKHDLLKARARCQVEVEDCFLGSIQGVDGGADELSSAWREDLKPDVVRHHSRCFYQAPCEVKVGLRGRREGHFDFFIAELDEHPKITPFLVTVLAQGLVNLVPFSISSSISGYGTYHGIYQTLVAVAKVGRQPPWWLVEGSAGP